MKEIIITLTKEQAKVIVAEEPVKAGKGEVL